MGKWRDPVYHEEGKWWFFHEDWANTSGPFDTEEEARKALRKYAEEFLGDAPAKE